MNDVASLELSKEMYELSGWKDTATHYHRDGTVNVCDYKERPDLQTPAYSLGYLLRKQPMKGSKDIFARTSIGQTIPDGYAAYWECDDGEYYITKADTPEDALCKLAIELFKQGVLKKETV